jgi:hypothetical protein
VGQKKKAAPTAAERDRPATFYLLSDNASNNLRALARKHRCTVSQAMDRLLAGEQPDQTMQEPSALLDQLAYQIERRTRHGNSGDECAVALINLVNVGSCEIYAPAFIDQSWISIVLKDTSLLVAALREAFRAQLKMLVSQERPSRHTPLLWSRKDPRAGSRERIAQLLYVWRLFDEVIEALVDEKHAPRLSTCARCGGFILIIAGEGGHNTTALKNTATAPQADVTQLVT